MNISPQMPCGQSVRIVNALGLHARAAGKIVKLLEQFDATVTIEKDNQIAAADSVMEILMLTAGLGEVVNIIANGPQAKDALVAIVNLFQQGFGEDIKES